MAAHGAYETTLEFECASAREADLLEGALGPETRDALPKARVTLQRDGDTIRLRVHASDAASLRAAINSYLRWAKTALDSGAQAR